MVCIMNHNKYSIVGNIWEGSARPVILKVVDIDPQGSIGPSKGLMNNLGVEWGSLNGQGVNE